MFEKEIKKFLLDTKNTCHYKQAFIPKGWTCVHIDTASKDLNEILNMKYRKVNKNGKA